MADGDEQPGRLEGRLLAALDVAQPDRLDLVVTDDVGHLAVPDEPDLVVGERTLLHDL
jgi:hypothetical protein